MINMEEKMWRGSKAGRRRDNNSSVMCEEAGQEVQPTVRRTDWVFSVTASPNDLPISDSSDGECYFIGVTNCRYLLWH